MSPAQSPAATAVFGHRLPTAVAGAAVYGLLVFPAAPGGGNPTALVPDAGGLDDAAMQGLARQCGHECAFVLPADPRAGADHDFTLRFWVPGGEMEMCGHATVGAVWLLHRLGRLRGPRVRLATTSGTVIARVTGFGTPAARVEVSQPQGWVEDLPTSSDRVAEILSVLGLGAEELGPWPVQNACTSRIKTLVPLTSPARLDALRPDFRRMNGLCRWLGSTGLYAYALKAPPRPAADWTGSLTADTLGTGGPPYEVAARQFPRASGYPEDPATGIAATALAYGLLRNRVMDTDGRPLRVHQGAAMGRPSHIMVRLEVDAHGAVGDCWVGGTVEALPLFPQ